MLHVLKLTSRSGAVKRITSATLDVAFEGQAYLARQGIIYHDLPGAQNGLTTDDFRLALLDKSANRRWSQFYLPKYVGVELDIRTLDNDLAEQSEYRFRGKSVSMQDVAAPEGIAIRLIFRGPLETRGQVREIVTVDEFQRIDDVDDDFLAYAERSRRAITEGIELG